ncbi:Protein of unknown function [Shimia gijangensis]|uniref:UDP-N-acetylmuramate--alanine ligase n=1 Tax=Shimia gijangensis TaxID=1470563 RepID=A0A1M6KWD8_9RHOB|nr:DUF2484 family protein [Shimia gijangensis]SHJ63212.1 Protein of unknown function [Shimia gijangensis]
MTLSLILACFWVVAATVVAMLPMRRQYVPGVALLLAAPVLIGAIWWDYGMWVGLAALFAFVSMFRNPLRYLWKRARGEKPELPE